MVNTPSSMTGTMLTIMKLYNNLEKNPLRTVLSLLSAQLSILPILSYYRDFPMADLHKNQKGYCSCDR